MQFLFSFELALFVSAVTSFIYVIPLCIVGAIVLACYDRRIAALSALSLIATEALVWLIKDMFAIPRPDDALISLTSYAFPSGHAALSFAIATVTAWLFVFFSHTLSPHRLPFILGVYLLASYIAYTRIILGVHTWFQVGVGALIGIVIPSAIFSYYHFKRSLKL